MNKKFKLFVALAMTFFLTISLSAQQDGDALYLQSYKVAAGDEPDVTDGDIADTDPEDWKSAYVRVVEVENNIGDNRNLTLLYANNDDYLYIGASLYLGNTSENNRLRVMFDVNNDETLSGTSESSGEYCVELWANGEAPTSGGFDGNDWVFDDGSSDVELIGTGIRKGGIGEQLYNFEVRIPLSSIGISADDKPGVYVEVYRATGSEDERIYSWTSTNQERTSPSTDPGWASLQLQKREVSVRDVSALYTKSYVPDIDGDVSGDDNWAYGFQKGIVFTDYNGQKLTNCKIFIKQDKTNLYLGLRIPFDAQDNTDYVQVYFDQGTDGNDRNYVLNPSARYDDAARITSDSTYQDMYFDGNSWESDGTDDGDIGVSKIEGEAWEFELSKPFAQAGDNQDLNIDAGDILGLLIRFNSGGTDYWWSATINHDVIKIDPETNNYGALGWGALTTGGPFVQPVYPEQNDVISGTYPLMLYIEDMNDGVQGISSVDFRITDTDDNIVLDYSSSRTLSKIDDTLSGLWTATLNTNTSSTPDDDYYISYRVVTDSGVQVTVPVSVSVLNSGTVSGPSVEVDNLSSGDVVWGDTVIQFTANPTESNSLVADSVQVKIDGEAWRRVDVLPPLTGGQGYDTLRTTDLHDGVHVLKFRAKDSGDEAWGYSDLIIFNVDNAGTLPVVTITGPADSTELNSVFEIEFSAVPHTGRTIDSCEISVDGFNWTRTTTDSTHTFNSTGYPDGTHIVQIRAYDNSGRIGYSEPVAFILKNTPGASIVAPSADSVVSGTLVVSFSAVSIAPATIASTEISIDGGDWRATSTVSTDTLDTQDLTEGSHTVQVRATDSNGKVGYSGIVKFVVKNNPTVTLLYPTGDATITGSIEVGFIAEAVAPATIVERSIYVDGESLDTASTDTTYLWNTTEYNDGQHTIQVRVTDSNGKTAVSEIVSVTLFNTPVVSITAPSDTAVVSGVDTIRFSVDYPEGVERDTTEISFNGGEWIPTTSELAHIWITTDFLDGNHTVQVRATGTNNKTGYSQIAGFKVSNVPLVTILNPEGGEAIAGTYTVRFLAEPVAPATISRYSISIDGGPWTGSLVDSASFEMETAGWENGTHSIEIRVVDNRGRIGYSGKRLFVVDNEAPMVADPQVVYDDGDNIVVRAGVDVLVTVLVKDNIVGLSEDSAVVLTSESIDTNGMVTYLMRDDGQGGDKVKGDNVFSVLVKVNTDSTGSVGYSITAVDRLGNDTTLTSVIKLDNTPPVTDFVLEPEPENGVNIRSGSTYFRRLVMKGSYSDDGGSGLEEVLISVINDSGMNVNTSPIVLSAEDSVFSRVIELIPGKNNIKVYTRDRAGNIDTTTGSVTYYEPKSTEVIGTKGGVVNNPDGASVRVSKDALLSSTEITIVPVEPVEQRKPLDTNIILLNVAHDFGPDGTVFRKPVIVTLPYTEADLDTDQDGERDIDPAKLTVAYWDGETWLKAGEPSIDTMKKQVSVSVNHFTIFDLIVDDSKPVKKLRAYWTKNPVKSDRGAAFRFDLPKRGDVGLRIVDMAGDLVRTLVDESAEGKNMGPGTAEVVWNGDNVSDEFAGAGLYIYVFTYKPQAGKTAVIRKPVGLLR